jgi:putative transcriptional regulator
MSIILSEAVYGLGDHALHAMATLREFDSSTLPCVGVLNNQEIKEIRLRVNVSQAVFAKCLNVSLSTIKQWERGEKKPRGTALLLLHLVSKRGLNLLFNEKELYV